MDLMEAMRARHSVRQYTEEPVAEDAAQALEKEIRQCNKEGGLHIQLVLNEPRAFNGFLAHYGNFRGVRNYIALIGPKGPDLDEKCGYYGERLVLLAQQLGLNTCWAALTYSKVKAVLTIPEGEKLCAVIALGYGQRQGTAHRSKPAEAVTKADGPVPDWFQRGVEAALLAPTAMNQQRFTLTLTDGKASVQAGPGLYTRMDLGIVRYHFELAAGREHCAWCT